MKYFLLILFFTTLFSCNTSENLTPQQIRIGTFKTTIKDGSYKSFAIRNDSLQIETFNHKKDTFYIHWISNFEYSLLKKNPKTAMDKKKFIVKITRIKQNSYTFLAYFEGNNFKQKGIAEKIN